MTKTARTAQEVAEEFNSNFFNLKDALKRKLITQQEFDGATAYLRSVAPPQQPPTPPPPQVEPAPQAPPAAPAAPIAPKPAPRPQQQGNARVSEVQRALNTLKYPGKDTRPLKEDGILGGNTQFAINNYRSQKNIDPSTTQDLVYQYIVADAKKMGTPSGKRPHAPVARASALYEMITK